MKRFLAVMLAMAMMGTTAYGAEKKASENAAYMSIMRYGKTAYIVDPDIIADYTKKNGILSDGTWQGGG